MKQKTYLQKLAMVIALMMLFTVTVGQLGVIAQAVVMDGLSDEAVEGNVVEAIAGNIPIAPLNFGDVEVWMLLSPTQTAGHIALDVFMQTTHPTNLDVGIRNGILLVTASDTNIHHVAGTPPPAPTGYGLDFWARYGCGNVITPDPLHLHQGRITLASNGFGPLVPVEMTVPMPFPLPPTIITVPLPPPSTYFAPGVPNNLGTVIFSLPTGFTGPTTFTLDLLEDFTYMYYQPPTALNNWEWTVTDDHVSAVRGSNNAVTVAAPTIASPTNNFTRTLTVDYTAVQAAAAAVPITISALPSPAGVGQVTLTPVLSAPFSNPGGLITLSPLTHTPTGTPPTAGTTTGTINILQGLAIGEYAVDITVNNGFGAAVTHRVIVNVDPLAPTIAGPVTQTLIVGYTAPAFITGFTVTGNPAPNVTISGNDAGGLITWDAPNNRLQVAANVPAGSYPIILTAANTGGTDTHNFTLVVATPAPVPVTSITVTGPTTVSASSTITLNASVLPSNATNGVVTWESSNPAIASVNPATGVVTGHVAGNVTIIARATDGSNVESLPHAVTVTALPQQPQVTPTPQVTPAPTPTPTSTPAPGEPTPTPTPTPVPGIFSVDITEEQRADWEVEDGTEVSPQLEHVGVDDEDFAVNLLGEEAVNGIVGLDVVNEVLLGLLHNLTVLVGGEETEETGPVTITVDLTTLGLTPEQLIRLTGFVIDEETGSYVLLPGVFTEDGRTFTFDFDGSGIIGIMVYTMPNIFMRLTIGSLEYYLNGEILLSDVAPHIAQNRTLVPIRIVTEALGGTPRWDGSNRVAYLYFDDVTLRLPMGTALPDGLGMPVMLSNRVFVPLRYVSQFIGARVFWDAANRAVYVWMR